MTPAGIVLAAGASSRMGVPKAILRVGDHTFLDTLGEALRAAGCDPILAVVAEPTDAIRKNCRLADIELLVNPDPSRGQISSLRCGLKRLDGGVAGAVVLLVDQGSILPSTVRAVAEALSRAPAAVARYRKRTGHPVGFAREVFPELFSEVGDCGADRVVATLRQTGRLAEVDVEDPGVTRNLNTPEEYRAFCDHGASAGT